MFQELKDKIVNICALTKTKKKEQRYDKIRKYNYLNIGGEKMARGKYGVFIAVQKIINEASSPRKRYLGGQIRIK